MPKIGVINRFHEGELQAQRRAGTGIVAQQQGVIRNHLPDQRCGFRTNPPFVLLSGVDADGRIRFKMIEAPGGFATPPDPPRIDLAIKFAAIDPLTATFASGTDCGGSKIDLTTRHRFSGHLPPPERACHRALTLTRICQ